MVEMRLEDESATFCICCCFCFCCCRCCCCWSITYFLGRIPPKCDPRSTNNVDLFVLDSVLRVDAVTTDFDFDFDFDLDGDGDGDGDDDDDDVPPAP